MKQLVHPSAVVGTRLSWTCLTDRALWLALRYKVQLFFLLFFLLFLFFSLFFLIFLLFLFFFFSSPCYSVLLCSLDDSLLCLSVSFSFCLLLYLSWSSLFQSSLHHRPTISLFLLLIFLSSPYETLLMVIIGQPLSGLCWSYMYTDNNIVNFVITNLYKTTSTELLRRCFWPDNTKSRWKKMISYSAHDIQLRKTKGLLTLRTVLVIIGSEKLILQLASLLRYASILWSWWSNKQLQLNSVNFLSCFVFFLHFPSFCTVVFFPTFPHSIPDALFPTLSSVCLSVWISANLSSWCTAPHFSQQFLDQPKHLTWLLFFVPQRSSLPHFLQSFLLHPSVRLRVMSFHGPPEPRPVS